MMLREIHRRLDDLQRRRWFLIALTALVLLASGGVWGSLIGTTKGLDGQRRAIVTALADQNINDRDEHAVTLRERGTITVNGRTYGGPRLAERPELIFDAAGNVAAPETLAEVLIRDQYPEWAPRWLLEQPQTTWMLALVTTAWLILIAWMCLTLPFVLTLLATGAAVGLAWLLDNDGLMWACAGIGLLTFTFVLLTRAALLLYERPVQMLAVAHTVIKEASRTRIALVFIVLILIMLPLLPLGLDPEIELRYRIQTFISRSMGFTFYLAACLTIVLSCATVAFEIRDRQIWQLMTKPVSRLSYLLGKWLGVATVNLIIMVIAGVSIFTYIQYLREQPVDSGMSGYEDAQAVRDAVLTARIGVPPSYPLLTDQQLDARVEDVIESTPELATLPEVSHAERAKIRKSIADAYSAYLRSVGPGREAHYTFEGLEAARDLQSTLTLRYRFHILRDDEHETFPAVFYFNGNPELAMRRTYVPTISHVLSIPADLIRDDGTLTVSIVNLYEKPPNSPAPGALNFEAEDFELLYKVSSFEANFLRAVSIDWIKLSFLAMLGICCATFLSFPVACLMSFTIFIAGTIGPFLATSLEQYYPPSIENVDWGNIGLVITWAFKSVIRGVAQLIVFLLESFGQYRPTQLLVEGRLIAWSAVANGAVKVGVVWSGLSLLVGYVVLRSRQLAIYSGHG